MGNKYICITVLLCIFIANCIFYIYHILSVIYQGEMYSKSLIMSLVFEGYCLVTQYFKCYNLISETFSHFIPLLV